jgi:hypothetical protein
MALGRYRAEQHRAASNMPPDRRMRIWDVDPALLCRRHLLGEHRELHGLWNILVHGKMGYSAHPETRRWKGKLAALHRRHEMLVDEMRRRGYQHASPLPRELATGSAAQDVLITPLDEQLVLLRSKPCECLRPGDVITEEPLAPEPESVDR